MKDIKSQWLESHITLHSHQNVKEERANAWTHLLAAALSVAGMIVLIRSGVLSGSHRTVAGLTVFSISMVLLFTASGFYHLTGVSNIKRLLRVLDHSNIYFLIAGTYTPVLFALNNRLGNIFLLVIWGIAFSGIAFTLVFWGRFGIVHVLLYLAMGWLVVFIWDDVTAVIPSEMIKWVVAGGLTYSLGVIFYALKKIPYGHAVWHLFVLGGCGCFYWGILKYLAVM